jgi:hypothetical protein
LDLILNGEIVFEIQARVLAQGKLAILFMRKHILAESGTLLRILFE